VLTNALADEWLVCMLCVFWQLDVGVPCHQLATVSHHLLHWFGSSLLAKSW